MAAEAMVTGLRLTDGDGIMFPPCDAQRMNVLSTRPCPKPVVGHGSLLVDGKRTIIFLCEHHFNVARTFVALGKSKAEYVRFDGVK
jgi:hypothetical protein